MPHMERGRSLQRSARFEWQQRGLALVASNDGTREQDA